MCTTNEKEKRAEYTQDDGDIDIEVTEKAWPNVKTFHQFKDHPALGPGAVEESSVVLGPRGLARTEQEEDVPTPESSRPPSRAAVVTVSRKGRKKTMLHCQLARNRKKRDTTCCLS